MAFTAESPLCPKIITAVLLLYILWTRFFPPTYAWTSIKRLLCVCVFSSYLFCISISLDVPVGVIQEGGRTGFLIHLPSVMRALIYLARRVQPFLSLVDREVEFVYQRFDRSPLVGHFFYFIINFLAKKM